jgi:hypothetical protein
MTKAKAKEAAKKAVQTRTRRKAANKAWETRRVPQAR